MRITESPEFVALKRAYSYDQYREYYNRVKDDLRHISFATYLKMQRAYEKDREAYYEQNNHVGPTRGESV